jgi:cytochrome c oxidase assembly protein subunit 15
MPADRPPPPPGAERASAEPSRGLRRFAALLAAWTFFVVVAGSAVTSTRSGMADPEWPTFGGRLLPSVSEMSENRGLFFEHGHRFVAGLAVALTWVLAAVIWARGAGGPARWLALAAAVVGIVPAVLGGLTVRMRLPPQVSILHVAAAMAFLALNTSVAAVLGKRWREAPTDLERAALSPEDASVLARGAVFLAAAVYAQIILGAVPRHLHAGIEPHILWAFAVFTAVVLHGARVASRHSRLAGVFRPAAVLLLLVVIQIFLGFTAFIARPGEAKAPGSGLFEVVASAHQAAGALMLVASVVLAVRAVRLRRLAGPPVLVHGASLAGEAA